MLYRVCVYFCQTFSVKWWVMKVTESWQLSSSKTVAWTYVYLSSQPLHIGSLHSASTPIKAPLCGRRTNICGFLSEEKVVHVILQLYIPESAAVTNTQTDTHTPTVTMHIYTRVSRGYEHTDRRTHQQLLCIYIYLGHRGYETHIQTHTPTATYYTWVSLFPHLLSEAASLTKCTQSVGSDNWR